jgi:hypothetical protein
LRQRDSAQKRAAIAAVRIGNVRQGKEVGKDLLNQCGVVAAAGPAGRRGDRLVV